ncbi:MAG TPA: cytochrome d ubiquinol oxidase subunit II [Rickettsiales bacterium]|nr:cytochrome d ubiquinol oxidase subunit II [Rickettsiales bacterium]
MIPIPFDYETLRVAWWALLGILLIGFAVMDGFDMGVAFLNPFLAKTDTEHRIIINTVGPVWDGNQVWLILGGGAIFAAWPAVYATAFSGFYLAMFLTLVSLILRPVSFEYRNKFPNPKHRRIWDFTLFASGLVPPLVFGVAFGNLFQGVPFYLDEMNLPHYQDSYFGSFFHLLNPFALLCGLTSVTMLATHGAVYLAAKTRGPVQERAISTIYTGLTIWLILFAIGGLWVDHITGFAISGTIDHAGPSNPDHKQVVLQTGVWMQNYLSHPALFIVPLLAVLGCAGTVMLTKMKRHATAFIASGLMVAGTIATAGISLFPFLLPSSLKPNQSLTVWDASSSHMTLWLMTIAAIIFVPIILTYTSWAFHIMRQAVSEETIKNDGDHLY